MNIEQRTCFDLLHSSFCYSSATGMLIFEILVTTEGTQILGLQIITCGVFVES